jgi:hypothetical protein
MQAVRPRPEQRAEAVEASPLASTRSWSPEAEIGMRVAWRTCWATSTWISNNSSATATSSNSILVASFPHAFDDAQLVQIPSDATLAEAGGGTQPQTC